MNICGDKNQAEMDVPNNRGDTQKKKKLLLPTHLINQNMLFHIHFLRPFKLQTDPCLSIISSDHTNSGYDLSFTSNVNH